MARYESTSNKEGQVIKSNSALYNINAINTKGDSDKDIKNFKAFLC